MQNIHFQYSLRNHKEEAERLLQDGSAFLRLYVRLCTLYWHDSDKRILILLCCHESLREFFHAMFPQISGRILISLRCHESLDESLVSLCCHASLRNYLSRWIATDRWMDKVCLPTSTCQLTAHTHSTPSLLHLSILPFPAKCLWKTPAGSSRNNKYFALPQQSLYRKTDHAR